ncbi:anthranilate phosphoribosyltransferase [Chromobacterium subtsugae]|uniref:Anthranilate phosphoribosyltransferase n=1 Tax=Chromobacterium subtsugae TaxID=251747 RepID=A0ABS7FHB3_9NEIS|nr:MULTISPECIES: anthranilate phosphoribosyltransferase [Chromobacterium]KUM03677.1 anthranilate phosphoribosyltransferase [Chromobacterium subtsugae]KZE88339.1 anthranilate phosphoribosyltransferase [Chromobacterium sp. F49]MBW7568723.1 anthranilate phosphoribosyltransferase [Chromobacterium subtsugae]MBW8289447.1 anthranilate phosphoribosyltransferase [Chromobacterium subtsugae]OBU85925.1 anthranilate phosphoribosyltransferase [Chromobacterium subtsugae]
MISPQVALNRLIDGNELFYDEMLDLMRQIMRGELSPAQTAAILIGLRVKVESVSEIAAAATVMREFATHVPVADRANLVDTCGTGGDKSHTFNISTTAAFVAAAAGARVAKHGGRSVSSSSGSADVLEQLGVNLALSPEQAGRCIDEIGLGFMFAPNHHSAMKHVAPIRKELGARTIFNILGPLTNPADADKQLMGVFHPDLVGIQSRVLKQLGSKHVMIVHGCDGLDELTLSGPSMVAELKNGEILEYQVEPGEFGLMRCELKDLRADTAEQSRLRLLSVLDGEPGPARDIVLFNAGAAIYTADIAPSLADGVTMAREALDSGKARQKLDQLVALSRQFGN